MIKPRKPDKIKPGTPHPTKAYTVRGFNGKWITTKSYNADRRRREKAAKETKETKSTSKTTKSTSKTTPKKGGSLAKRVSSALTKTSNKAGELLKVNKGALTKTTNKAGELLKIKKGDKGLVRGVKDLYKMGKDTRNSANALYEAGKITREVHDKLVKGTKDFFGGVKESGKATKRVVNALKPGGKLVAQAKKFNGVNYDLIPKNIRGELAKVSTDGGKSKTFKFDYNKIPKDLTKKTPTRFRAPGTDNPRKDPSRPKKQTFETKAKNKLKSIKTNLKGEFNKTVGQGKNLANNLKMRLSKPNAFGYEDTNQANAPKRSTKSSNQLKMNRYLNKNYTGGKKGIFHSIAQPIANFGVDEVIDRLGRNISGNQKMSIKDYRAMKDENIQNLPNTLKIIGMHRDANKPQRVIGQRGRTIRTIQPEQTGGAIGRSRQEPYINREPQVSYKPEKVVPGPNTGTDSTKKETVDKVKIKKVKLNPNVPDMGYDIKKTKKKKKSGKSKEQIAWEKKSKNSPARKSKAFTDEQLWKQYKKHQEWLKKNNRLKVRS